MICVIPSAGRWQTMNTHRLFPDGFVCVPESEAENYRKVFDRVVAHPDSVRGMGQKRQWILDNFNDEIIFMADDDISHLCWMGGEGTYEKIKNPDHIWEVVLNTANIAKTLGTNLFGFNEIPDRRKFNYIEPFSTRDRINGFAMGVIKDGQSFDPRLIVKQDYDFFLMTLYWKRFVWRDDRYAFVADHYTNKGGGGLCSLRSVPMEEACIKILQQKYGKQVVGTVKDRPWTIVLRKVGTKAGLRDKG